MSDIEENILGCLILLHDSYNQVCDILQPHHFEKPENSLLYGIVSEIHESGGRVDLMSVRMRIKEKDLNAEIGGGMPSLYLADLVSKVANDMNLRSWAQMLVKEYSRKSLKVVFRDGEMDAERAEPDDLIERTRQRLDSIQTPAASEIPKTVGDTVMDYLSDVEKIKAEKDKGGIIGVPTFIKSIDELTGGWRKGDLVIIGARSSMGKTAFATYISVMASMGGYPGVFYSLEMGDIEIKHRIMSMFSMVPYERISRGELSVIDYRCVMDGANQMENVNLHVVECSKLTPGQLRNQLRGLVREKKIRFAVVDYLQLMSTTKKVQNREQEIADISRSLKQIAKDLQIPIIALSQLSRALESRAHKLPHMSDLRESGAIEQDADKVILLYRPAWYGKKYVQENYPGVSDELMSGITVVNVGKHRGGRLAMIPLYGRIDINRYDSCDDIGLNEILGNKPVENKTTKPSAHYRSPLPYEHDELTQEDPF